MTTTAAIPTPAERGLRLLSRQQLQRHPRAQVQTLRKMAVIAIGKAERTEEYSIGTEFEEPGDRARAAAYRALADDALAACIYLNRAHERG